MKKHWRYFQLSHIILVENIGCEKILFIEVKLRIQFKMILIL